MPRKFDPRKNLARPDGSPIPDAPAAPPPPVVPGVIIKNAGASEPMEQTIGQDLSRTLKSTGKAKQAMSSSVIEPVDRPVDEEKLAMMAFMEEMVEIHIHQTSNREDEQIFELFINGERMVFRRNDTKWVKRKWVDLLARLKPTSFTQQDVVDADGVRGIRYNSHTGLRYPFSVRSDNHPRGREWLQAVLSEA